MFSILLRTCLNVTTDASGTMIDETRYHESLPGIRQCADEADRIVIIAHLGRPKQPEDRYSFALLAKRLEHDLGRPIQFVRTMEILAQTQGQAGIFFLENVRFFPGEEHNNADERKAFAHLLAAGCDKFVNDAFADYRLSASTYDVATILPSHLGPLFQKEVAALDQVKQSPQHPCVIVLWGAKLSEKLDVLMTLLPQADIVLIGGAMAYTFLKAQWYSIGKSLIEEDKLSIASEMLMMYHEKIILPIDHTIIMTFTDPGDDVIYTSGVEIPDNSIAVDIWPNTRTLYKQHLTNAKTILRNWPMGVTERKATAQGTYDIGRCIAEQKQSYTLVWWGDSITAINTLWLKWFSHICTGGGAMLSYLGDDEFPTRDVIDGHYHVL